MLRTAFLLSWVTLLTACPNAETEAVGDPMPTADATPTAMDAGPGQTDASMALDSNTPVPAPADMGIPDAMPADALPADAMPADAMPADARPADALTDAMGSPDADSADAAQMDSAVPERDAMPPSPAVVALDGTGDYLDLQSALDARELDIIVQAGVYRVDQQVTFEHPGTHVRGVSAEEVRFVQTTQNQDLFVVRADNVTVSTLTLDTTTAGQAAFVEQGANNVTLQDAVVHGGDQIFSIYFAGPDVAAGDATLDAFDRGALSRGNRLLRTTITSDFVGDSVAFTLQAEGEVRENTLTRGMLALYMLQDVECVDNLIETSATNGIFISLPSRDLTVTGNEIRDAAYSAIIIRPQVEHDAADRGLHSQGVRIIANRITGRMFGIEVDGNAGLASQGDLERLIIRENDIQADDFAGIYLLRTLAPSLTENTITFIGADASRRGVDGRPDIADMVSTGIYLDVEVSDALLENNVILRTAAANDPRVMQNAVVLHAESVTGATVINNTFRRHLSDWVHSPCEDDFGPRDWNGLYVLTGGMHEIEGNVCEASLP